MEAALLMLEVVAISQLLVWIARGRGESGFFAWKSNDPKAGKTKPTSRHARSSERRREG